MAHLAVEQGQTIGNHSYDHPDFSSISDQEQESQLERNADAWWKASGRAQPFFRPPYGSNTVTTLKAAGDAGYRYVVMWNGDAGDWRGLSASQVAANALAAAKPGAIIVFHTQWQPCGPPRSPQGTQGQGPQGREPGATLRRRRPALLIVREPRR